MNDVVGYKQALSEKDELLQLLGAKCLELEEHIEKLTRKYIGDTIINADKGGGEAWGSVPAVVRKRS